MIKQLLVVGLCLGLAGCASKEAAPQASATATTQSIAVDSLFAKVKEGMGMKQVQDLIGQPSDISSRKTGKGWIPYYYGADRVRSVHYYKNEGRLEFNQKARLVAILYDPKEDGYR